MRKLLLLTTIFVSSFEISYTQPGSRDSSFGNKGTIIANLGSNMVQSSIARQVLSQTDGSLYIVFESAGFTLIEKKRPDGLIDSAFGKNGYSVSVTINDAHAALQKDGKIMVAGSVFRPDTDHFGHANTDFALARFNADNYLLPDDKTKRVFSLFTLHNI